ncbi:hypothetical protein GSI_13799 [Ganoderma sinense ZZ0214-1]|uniref:U4/U6.U5 small nuclear ribonucleoprotein 27kDa protein domain-containing protein n=1 Tax=Ganoderma sinense ZZ0214-1 TaxID=1077348 RepID=A0A2G8RRU3_9APHY|nr:hypothetical protein GSI_13799 [Ganoderma sinense ZZ0214-1]
MSSRHDYRRRDRSWERDERDRDRGGHRGGRRSRSRSPPRRGERDRRGGPVDRRDHYARDREDDRRDPRRDDRRQDDRDRRDQDRDRDGKREPPPPPRDVNRDRHGKDKDGRQADRASEHDAKPSGVRDRQHTDTPESSASRPRQDSEASVAADGAEEGEEMDATIDDDAAMMAMMGMGGFGSTKGKHVEGNQDGNVNIKKQRTWRQYMNRRGGFNRPLDKIK